MSLKSFKRFLRDQRGQTNIIGNIISFIESQPWIMVIVFLAAIYATTFKFNIFGFEFQLFPIINSLVGGVLGSFGFGFDWRYFVIICFLSPIVYFIFTRP